MPHVIRLRGPWQCGGKTFDWEKELKEVLGAADERIVLKRNFGLPTGLGPNDTLRLVIAGLRLRALRLNGAPLLEQAELEQILSAAELRQTIDITPRLQSRNVLEIECDPETTSTPHVQLEVHP